MGGGFIYSDPPVETLLGQEREGFTQYVTSVTDSVGIPLAVLLSPQRDGNTVILRQQLMAVARYELDWTCTRTGQFFHRDHATVVHACNSVRNRLKIGDWTAWFSQCAVACDAQFRIQYDQPLKILAPCLIQKKSA